MFSKHKWPTWEGICMILLIIISIFSIGFLTEDKITGMAVKDSLEKVTGNMVKVTGMKLK